MTETDRAAFAASFHRLVAAFPATTVGAEHLAVYWDSLSEWRIGDVVAAERVLRTTGDRKFLPSAPEWCEATRIATVRRREVQTVDSLRLLPADAEAGKKRFQEVLGHIKKLG